MFNYETSVAIERWSIGKAPGGIVKRVGLPVILLAQQAHGNGGLLFHAVVQSREGARVTRAHERVPAVQSRMLEQARREPSIAHLNACS